MLLRTPLILGSAVVGLLAATALPASADDTATTFAMTGGTLSLSVVGTAILDPATSGQVAITGDLGAVSVTDLRGGTAPWIVTAGSSVFTGALALPSTSTSVTYTAGAVAHTGTMTVVDGAAVPMTVAEQTVVAPSALSGNNTASWEPQLDVVMPATALADTYSGLVTTSVA